MVDGRAFPRYISRSLRGGSPEGAKSGKDTKTMYMLDYKNTTRKAKKESLTQRLAGLLKKAARQ